MWKSLPFQKFLAWRSGRVVRLGCMAAIVVASCGGIAAAQGGASDADGGAAGVPGVSRQPWTGSRITGRPEPPPPYRVVPLFPRIAFKQTTLLDHQPLLDRFFVGELAGKIHALPKDRQSGQATVFFDGGQAVARLNRGRGVEDKLEFESLFGMAFDPDFVRNRFCYVCYVVRSAKQGAERLADGTRVVRLRVGDTEPPACDPESEQLVISWLQGGHNGGCLRFGPDGCLYISSGDGGVSFPPDGLRSGQDLLVLRSKVLRIDVRSATAEKPYTIPADNPFVGFPSARGEVWAYGVRNPWKMSFDRLTGELWAGDVGWELWELVLNVRRGENYGWSIVEGRQAVNTGSKAGPTPIVPPTLEIPHDEGASITGGFVYRGRKFPELVGHYVFGDWETRRIWAAKVTDGKLGEYREIVEPVVRIVDFAEDADGELYLLDHDDGGIFSLEPRQAGLATRPFPQKLSETGLFASVKDHVVAPGIVPFAVNAEQWSDRAAAERFVAVPDSGTIRVSSRPRRVTGSMFQRSAEFPRDSVLVKTLALEMEVGKPGSTRRIETQILHHDGREWLGYTYAWNDDQTDATLVARGGAEREFTVRDPAVPGGGKTQRWRYSARAECLRCHNPWSEHALAFNLPQLNRTVVRSGTSVNQIAWLEQTGLLASDTSPDPQSPLPFTDILADPARIPRLASPFDHSPSLEARARAYLHVNCAHCHRFGGGGSARLRLNNEVRLADTLVLGVAPTQGSFGIADAALVAPGDPCRSVLYFRLNKTGPGHMPHLGTREIDDRGVALIHDWIAQIPLRFDEELRVTRLVELDEPRWLSREAQARSADEKSAAEQIARRQEREEPNEEDAAAARAEVARGHAEAARSRAEKRRQLLAEFFSQPSAALVLADAMRRGRMPEWTRGAVLEAARGPAVDAPVRDLFEAFMPEETRTRRRGERPVEAVGR